MSGQYVLVVDDEPDIRELVSEILQDEGYQVATAEGGVSARQSLRERRPDLCCWIFGCRILMVSVC